MRTIVKILPVPGVPKNILVTYEHPLYGKIMRRFFPSIESVIDFKRKTEQALSTDGALSEMSVLQLLLLFKEERPTSPLFIYRKCFLLEFLETFGDALPRDLTESVMDMWLQHYSQERNHLENTISGDKKFLNYFFRFLIEKGVIEKTPIKGSSGSHIIKQHPLSAEEAGVILSETKRLSPGHLYPMALMAMEAKARTEEIFALRWKDVELGRRTVAFERGGYRELHKMSDELLATLSKVKRASLLVFVSQQGRPMDGVTMFQTRARFRKQSTYKGKWTLDDLRRTP